AVAAAPVELLDRADKPELPFLHEIVHVQALANETAGVGYDQTEVCTHELVDGTLRIVAAAGERAPGARIRAARTKSPAHSVEQGTLEALGRQLDGQSCAATTAALTRRGVARRTSCRRGGSAFEQPRKALDSRGIVAVLLRVAQQRRGQDTLIAQLGCKRAQRHGGLGASQQRLQRVAFTILDALREAHLFLVREDAASSTARCKDRGRRRVVGDGRVDQDVELDGLLLETHASGGEGCARCVHGSASE
ncbi:MAG TPA: hypothetical protein VGY54_06545, partial [Polyangiaceae bacterium]|nr:hypothetical protein [Polyangiaceae bacterium]